MTTLRGTILSSPVVSVQVLVGQGGEVGRDRTGDDEDKERDQVQSGHDWRPGQR